jgi:glutathione S-transferase
MKIYGDLQSGNCLKVKYTADLLGLKYEWVAVDVTKGESRTPEYLAKFPQGQVPAIELADGRTLAQSNAIIRYLARSSYLLPDDPFTQAKIDEWLFWEQYSHEPYVAVCRYHMFYLGKSKESRDPMRVERGEKALDHMERHLELVSKTPQGPLGLLYSPKLVGITLSIADICLFAYTRVAHEGGFGLGSRPHLEDWISRCEQAFTEQQRKDYGW